MLAELRLQKIQLLNYILTILSLGQRVEKQNSKIYRPCVQDVISEKVILSDKRGDVLRNDDERSYERYKQYRRNKYRYEQEQIIFPIAIIIGLSIIISLWKYILIAIAVVSFLAVVVAILYLYLKKQLKSEQDIVLSKEDAKEGVEANISVNYDSQTVSFVFNIPPNVKDGQKFVAKNILFENKKGKKVKKNVHFKVIVQ